MWLTELEPHASAKELQDSRHTATPSQAWRAYTGARPHGREMPMTISPATRWLPLMVLATLAVGHAQQGPSIGLPVPPLGVGPCVFDTAEKQKIRVTIVTRGLS